MMPLTHARLIEVLAYDKSTGLFVRLLSVYKRKDAGKVAGDSRNGGYARISIDGERYLAHRLAWFFVYQRFPLGDIDHIDGNKSNNAIANLREATHIQNMQNQRKPKVDGTSGFLGVTWHKGDRRWQAQIVVDRRYKYLGSFNDKDAAKVAYLEAKRELHPFGNI